jgi:hypothetical protein
MPAQASNVVNSTGRFGIGGKDMIAEENARRTAYRENLFTPVDEANRYRPTEGADEFTDAKSRRIALRGAESRAKAAKDEAIANAQNEEVPRALAVESPRLGIRQQELAGQQTRTGLDAQRLGLDTAKAGTDAQQAQATIAESQLNAQEKEQLNAARAKVSAAKTPEERDAATRELAALSGNFPQEKVVNPNWAYVEPETNVKGEVTKEGFYYDKNSATNPGKSQPQNVDPRLAHLPGPAQEEAMALLEEFRASKTPANKKRIAAALEKLGVK